MDQRAELPLDLLLPPDPPMRDQEDPQAFAELVADIRVNGILQPIVVAPEGDRYRTVAGDRRRRAAAAAGLVVVPVVIRELSRLQRITTTIRENLLRLDAHPLEEGRMFAQLQDEQGLSTEEIATLVHKSASYVATRLRALRLPADVQEALRAGKVNLTVALELGKVAHDEDRIWLLHHASSGGATAEVVRAWVADATYRRQTQPAGEGAAAPVVHPEAPPVIQGTCEWHRHLVPLDRLLKLAVCVEAYNELLAVRDAQAQLDAAATKGDGPDAST